MTRDSPASAAGPGLRWLAALALEAVAEVPGLGALSADLEATHVVDYGQFIKKLRLAPGFTAPVEMIFEDLVACAITRADLRDDVRGINASIDLIRRTRGGGWPTGPVTEEFNFVDLVWHELEFRDGTSFAYVIRDAQGAYLGCCYLYPMGRRTPLSEQLLGYDVDVSWWVTPTAYARGDYHKLYRALRHWVTHQFPFEAPFYSNLETPDH